MGGDFADEMPWFGEESMGTSEHGQDSHCSSRRMSFSNANTMSYDGRQMDPQFEDICRATVGFETQQLVVNALNQSKCMSRDGGIGGESVYVTSPSRLANFFRGDGAVYAQYELSSASYSGGALPDP